MRLHFRKTHTTDTATATSNISTCWRQNKNFLLLYCLHSSSSQQHFLLHIFNLAERKVHELSYTRQMNFCLLLLLLLTPVSYVLVAEHNAKVNLVEWRMRKVCYVIGYFKMCTLPEVFLFLVFTNFEKRWR